MDKEQGNKGNTLPKVMYMVVTHDKYELPFYVSERVRDVAEVMKMTESDVFKYIRTRAVRFQKYRIIKVILDDEED